MPGAASERNIRPLDLIAFGQMDSMIVRAGAGAGKTTELVERVLSIGKNYYLAQKKWPRLVVTTFTRKATQELKERLLARALELNDHDLVNFVSKPSLVHVSTIHGVLALYLARYGLAIGLAPEFNFIASSDEQKNMRKCLRRLFQEQPDCAEHFQQLMQAMSLQQLEKYLLHFFEFKMQYDSPKLVTAEDVARASELYRQQLISEGLKLCERLAREESTVAWARFVDQLRSALQQGHRQALLTFRENIPSTRSTKQSNEATMALKEEFISKLKDYSDFSFSEEFVLLYRQWSEAFLFLYERWSGLWLQEKIESAQLTMGDLENLSLYLMKNHPVSAENFSQDWNYWLIDEYQDTSPRQVVLLNQLVGAKNSFVVGDPQQSIYLFRGARSEVFSEKEDELRKLGQGIYTKMENYRSRPELLEFFNFFFAHLSPHFTAMIPANNGGQPLCPEDPVAVFYNQSFDDKEASQAYEEAAVVSRVAELLAQGVSPEKICILASKNSELKRMAKALTKNQIPIQLHSSMRFYERREIRDALALLKFLLNQYDCKNLVEILRSPWLHLSDKTIADLSVKKNKSLWENLRHQDSLAVVTQLKSILQQSQLMGVGQAWVQALIDLGVIHWSAELDPAGRYEANIWKLIYQIKIAEKNPGFNYLSFIEKLETTELDPEASDGDAVPVIEPARVNLMTIHASKGLQFDAVIVPCMGSRSKRPVSDFMLTDNKSGLCVFAPPEPEEQRWLFPWAGEQLKEQMSQREQQEHDRLLYVALTRAKSSVTLIWTRQDSKSWNASWAARMWKPQELGAQAVRGFKIELRSEVPPLAQIKSAAPTKAPLTQSLKWQSQGGQRIVSVTQLIDQLPGQASEQPAESHSTAEQLYQAATFAQEGTEAHRIFESLKYGVNLATDKKLLQAVEFVRTWQSGTLSQVIQSGEAEWGFTARLADDIVQGQIDLWGWDLSKTLWIIDYKTGSEKYASKALRQLQIYCLALKTVRPELAQVTTSLAVVYPHLQKVIVDQAPQMQELHRQLLEKPAHKNH